MGYDSLYREVNKLAKKYPPLGKEKERQIIEIYKKTGEQSLKEKLIYSNLRLIIGEVKKFHSSLNINPDLFMELISLAFTEATESIERFSLERGNASVCSFIRNSVKQALLNFSKENIDFNGQFNTVRRFANRFQEELLEGVAFNYFAQAQDRFPSHGDTYVLSHRGKTQDIAFFNKPTVTIQSGNTVVDKIGNELFNTLEIEYDTDAELQYDISEIKNNFSKRDGELYEFLFEKDLQRGEAIYWFAPMNKKEEENAKKTGSNLYSIDGINFNFVSYKKNTSPNPHRYCKGGIAFDHGGYDGAYVINTAEAEINVSDFITGAPPEILQLKQGYPFSIQVLNSIYREFIDNIRKKNLIHKKNKEYYEIQ